MSGGCYESKADNEHPADYTDRRIADGEWYMANCHGCLDRCSETGGSIRLEVVCYKGGPLDEVNRRGYVTPLCCMCKSHEGAKAAKRDKASEMDEQLRQSRLDDRGRPEAGRTRFRTVKP